MQNFEKLFCLILCNGTSIIKILHKFHDENIITDQQPLNNHSQIYMSQSCITKSILFYSHVFELKARHCPGSSPQTKTTIQSVCTCACM